MSDERRQFYRIDDEVFVSFYHVNPHTNLLDLQLLEQQTPISFRFINELQMINSEAKRSLEKLNKTPEVKTFLKKLEQKIQSVGEVAVQEYLSNREGRKLVSISGNGLRVMVDSELPVDSIVRVELLLPESITAILCYAKVVVCENKQDHFESAVTFEKIREIDRDAIIGHIMKKEAKTIRKKQPSEGENV